MITVLDVETSRLNDEGRVVEVAAVTLIPNPWDLSLAQFSWLVNPGHSISPGASGVHHLTDDDVAGAPEFAEVERLATNPPAKFYAAHNAAFDRKYFPTLKDADWICTWRCALHLWSSLEYPPENFKNQTLRFWLKTKPKLPEGLSTHRALYDAIVTAETLKRMLDLKTPEELVALTNTPVLMSIVNFGMHRGKAWSDVPTDYLLWMLRQRGEKSFDEDAVHTAQYWVWKRSRK